MDLKAIPNVEQPTEPEVASPPQSLLSCTWRLQLAVFIAASLTFANGCITAYPSPAIPNMNENRNPFHVTDDQQSWAGSIVCLGWGAGGVVSGTSCDVLGRKLAMIATSLFVVIGATIITAATNMDMVYAGIFVSSFFGQISFTAATLYTSEVTPVQVRGTCMALISSAYSMGIVVSYAVGIPLDWNWLAVFGAALYVAPNLVLVFLPESPRWFLMKGNKEAAIHGIKWLRDGFCDYEEVRAIEDSLPDRSHKGKCDHSSWSGLVNTHNRMSLFICTMLFVFQSFSGNIVLQMFTVTIFQYAGTTQIDPNMQTVISGLFLVAGSFLCPPLIDRIGRKMLLIASTVTVCISMAAAAAFFLVLETNPEYAHQNLYWLPVVGLSVSNFGFAAGIFPVPYILSCEMFSTNVRGSAQTVLTAICGMANFACIKTFINIQDSVNNSGAFFIYAGICAAATLFIMVFMKNAPPSILQ